MAALLLPAVGVAIVAYSNNAFTVCFNLAVSRA
jgi:hypothetical protein